MPRVTIAQLVERIDAMQVEIDELRAAADVPSIQYVRELTPPKPISESLNVHALARGVFVDYSFYDEDGDVYSGFGVYI